MKVILLISMLSLTCSALAIERKSADEIDINALTNQTQAVGADANKIDLAWWIPVEFWEASLGQTEDMHEAQIAQMLGVLRNYDVLAIIQADISPFGAFRFFDKDSVMGGLQVHAIDASGKARKMSHTEPADPDMQLLLDMMKPMLAQAMGNLGENFYFFPLPAFDNEDNRVLSPYENGKLRVTLQRGEETVVLEIELPIDALFVPRICPNGKPAHVSWVYCPWSGEKLEQ